MKIRNPNFLAEYGTDAHRDQLVNHHDFMVRTAVAENGTDKHRDQLINDEDHYVRRYVALTGNRRHVEALRDDPHITVRMAAKQRIRHFKSIGTE